MILKHGKIMRDLIVNANDTNIDIIMDLIAMFENVSGFDNKVKFKFDYFDRYIQMEIYIGEIRYCVFQFLHDYRIFYYANMIEGITTKEITWEEARDNLRKITENTDKVELYEVGAINGFKE